MKEKQNNNVAHYISVAAILLFFGCTVEQTHKTFTFFFDGVDRMVFVDNYAKDSIRKASEAKRQGLLKKVRPDLFVHQPYKEKKCEKCHTPDKKLLMPMPELCFQCHQNFNSTYSTVHGPVASGNCIKCHNQHSSKYPKLLTRQGQQVCTYCHSPQLIFSSKFHKDIEDAECTLCHNPHGGKNRFMMKDNVPRDANRIGLMNELTSRHLYGQIFCKEPGDVTISLDIRIYDETGMLVATVHPDNNGKFLLSNMHPDHTYTFRINHGVHDCKINVTDNNGKLLFLIERDKTGKYQFSKSSYEAVHNIINDANETGMYPDSLGVTPGPATTDTAKAISVPVNNTKPEEVQQKAVPEPVKEVVPDKVGQQGDKQVSAVNVGSDSARRRNKITVKELPDNVSTEDLIKANRALDTVRTAEVPAEQPKDTTRKSKIVVKDVPADVSTKRFLEKDKQETKHEEQPAGSEAVINKSKIVVKDVTEGSQPGRAKKLPKNAGATETIRKYERENATLMDLAIEINRWFDGSMVCVMNDSADYLDLARVDKSGKFLLFDFLSYHVTVPDSSSGIVSQVVFLNDRMEVIEVVNKRVKDGRYVFVSNTREPSATRARVQVFADKSNAVLFGTIYYEQASATITSASFSELDKAVQYLRDHPASRVYLAAHTDSRGSIGYNQQLSEQRAAAAKQYIISHGIKKTRVTGKGFGSSKPANTYGSKPATEEAHKKNRRVEIYIKDK